MNKIILTIALAIILIAGCKNETAEEVHEHGPEPLGYTLYSDSLEVFVEFQPLVIGKATKFAAHFTVLAENFVPLTEGSVTISLIVEGKGIKQTVDIPNVPGIYPLSLKPTTAGTGKLIFDIKTKNFTDRIVIENVKVHANENAASTQHQVENSSNDISYSKEQAWKVDFANALINKTSFSDVIKTNGQILPAPGDEMILTAKANGIVLFSGSNSIIGTEVNADTSLFTISSGDLAEGNIDATFKGIKANYEKTKSEYERATELVKDKIVSQKDFLQAKTEFENAQTAYSSISKNYSAKGQSVSSPIHGYIKNILVTEGQFVAAGTPLASISKNKKLILQANVSQKYFNKLTTISSANFKMAESESVYSTTQLNGKIISYGKSASAHSPFIPITFEIDNTSNLIPGSVVEVYLKSIPISDALVIPVSSLIEEQGNYFVYLQIGGESFRKQEVKIGASDGVNVQLLSGVEEGERVVSKGAYQIKLSQASGTLPAHGHEH